MTTIGLDDDSVFVKDNKVCTLKCVLDKKTRTCEGCGRTLEEIAEAGLYDRRSV